MLSISDELGGPFGAKWAPCLLKMGKTVSMVVVLILIVSFYGAKLPVCSFQYCWQLLADPYKSIKTLDQLLHIILGYYTVCFAD